MHRILLLVVVSLVLPSMTFGQEHSIDYKTSPTLKSVNLGMTPRFSYNQRINTTGVSAIVSLEGLPLIFYNELLVGSGIAIPIIDTDNYLTLVGSIGGYHTFQDLFSYTGKASAVFGPVASVSLEIHRVNKILQLNINVGLGIGFYKYWGYINSEKWAVPVSAGFSW